MRSQHSSTFLGEVFYALAKSADTPVSLASWLMYKYGEHDQLARKDINPAHYNDHLSFETDYIVVKFLSKYKGLNTTFDIEKVALDTWQQAEVSCAMTNKRLREGRVRGISPRVDAVLFTAKRKIASLLGPLDRNVLVKAFESGRWGPGATFSLKGEAANLVDKIREYPISVTPRALPYLKAVIEADPHWASAMLELDVDGPVTLLPGAFKTVPGCRATLVDKSAKTKRSIAIEPTGNIFLQLGIGRVFRERLQRVGVDLNDQTLNQRLAEYGSLTGFLATVDLSSASDTVSRELVYELFPLDWSLLLDQCRSPELTWDGGKTWVRLEKFSSMGNGFTFELESIIFWAVSSALYELTGTEGTVSVYGDDIVIDSRLYTQLAEVLSELGFSVNTEKSFHQGSFRESCGKHYWDGHDVTPVYQKEVPDTLQEVYRLANRIHRCALRRFDESRYARRSWLANPWYAAVRGIIPFLGKTKRGPRVVAPKTDLRSMVEYIAMNGGHAVPLFNESDDGLMLPYRYLQFFVQGVGVDGWVKLPVYSFRPRRVKPSSERALLSYWLRFHPDEPFKGLVSLRGRGRWQSRRRWFFDAYYVSDPSALDVALS